MNKKIVKTNYDNSVVSVANSIRKYFGLSIEASSLHYIDKNLLLYKPKNVIIILLDGFGKSIINKNLRSNTFLRKNIKKTIYSTIPSTTTTATTSLYTGLEPISHCWLGWNMYYEKEDVAVTMFTNEIKDTKIKYGKENLANKYFNYDSITDIINKEGKYYSKMIMPFGKDKYVTFDDMLIKMKKNLNKKERNYIYAYCEQPDECIHKTGSDSKETKDICNEINKKIKNFSKNLKNSTLIVMSDHGHKNSEEIVLENYPDLFNLLKGETFLDSRFCAFRVKEDKKIEFEKKFNTYFSEDFMLKSKNEIIKEKIFGNKRENKYFRESIGDYIAIAIGNKCIRYKYIGKTHFSSHSGITEEEMLIPLIVINK